MEIKQFKLCEHSDVVLNLWNEVVSEKDFYYQFDKAGFESILYKNPHFKEEGAFVAYEGETLIGFAVGFVRNEDIDNPNAPGYFNTIVVKKEFRRQGVGTALLNSVEGYFKKMGKTASRSVFLSPVNWPWYIPGTDHHNHPGCPAIPVNTPEYFFLLHNGYHMQGQIDAFHLDLEKFEMPKNVLEKMKENEAKGLTVEVYDPNKHYGVDEFCEAIQNPGFARSIKYNLQREEPRPFLIVSDNNRMAGWTGPMYTESTGRGHLDGIAVDPNVRGGGLGKALFCKLCEYSKNQGSSFMTFFTGLENKARYIYLAAGFDIIQTFGILRKELK